MTTVGKYEIERMINNHSIPGGSIFLSARVCII